MVSAIAGAALLAGTAGTFALWQTSDALGADFIRTGNMTLSVDWDVDNDIEFWVPTDSVEGTVNIDVHLLGDNLKAELTLAEITDEEGDVITPAVALEVSGDDLVASFGFTNGLLDATLEDIVVTIKGAAELLNNDESANRFGASHQDWSGAHTWEHELPVTVEFVSTTIDVDGVDVPAPTGRGVYSAGGTHDILRGMGLTLTQIVD